MLNQQLNDTVMALFGGVMERCPSISIDTVNIGASFEEELRHDFVTLDRSVMQGRSPTLIRGVHSSAPRDQRLDHGRVTLGNSKV